MCEPDGQAEQDERAGLVRGGQVGGDVHQQGADAKPNLQICFFKLVYQYILKKVCLYLLYFNDLFGSAVIFLALDLNIVGSQHGMRDLSTP